MPITDINKITIRKPVKYLTNKELLAEINRCKKTFCYFISSEFENFDGIVHNLEEVTPSWVKTISEKKAKDNAEWVSGSHEGIVIRLMTYDHIPLDPDRKRRSRATNQTHAHTVFPPFKHYAITGFDKETETYEVQEVGRSFWEGGLENGWFSPNKGRMTERMGRMFQLLVEKYAHRANWRNYCVDTETEALTKRGWLHHDEINESDEVLSYHEGKMVWSKIRSIYRNANYDGLMHHLTSKGFDALVTPNHKFVTDSGIKPVEKLKQKDRLVLCGEPLDDEIETFSDAFVELIGWILTEGNYHKDKERNYTRVSISQKGAHAERIRECILAESTGFDESKSRKTLVFSLRKELCERIETVMPNKVFSADFLLSLSMRQRKLLLRTIINGDGWDRGSQQVSFAQKRRDVIDGFTMLCSLLGLRTSIKQVRQISFGNPTECHIVNVFSSKHDYAIVENIDFHGGKADCRTSQEHSPTVPYGGMVWCLETEYGSFFVRRNGYSYLTGNSYNDEMQSLAIVQLAQVGLQFDESKSSNPFAFYTTTITNCFRRIINVEKRSQSLRDDLLIAYGANPSYTRQIENEMARNGNIEPTKLIPKKGRKTAIQVKAEAEAEKQKNPDNN